jgi:DNA polymerase phi
MVKGHSECLTFIKENISAARLRSQKRIQSSQTQEIAIREKQTFKRLIAFELLFNNLALLLMIPEMFAEVENDLEELKQCFTNLGLTSQQSEGKRSKKGGKGGENHLPANPQRSEALDVLVDFLISLLTKPQSFLRDIANFTFKQFCTEVSPKALANLVQIVQTPNIEATKMLFDEDELEEEVEAEEGDEDSEDDDEEDKESDESD